MVDWGVRVRTERPRSQRRDDIFLWVFLWTEKADRNREKNDTARL